MKTTSFHLSKQTKQCAAKTYMPTTFSLAGFYIDCFYNFIKKNCRLRSCLDGQM